MIYRRNRQEIPLEDVYPALKEFPDDPGARVAALWDFGNLCALSPYPDSELAMEMYAKAIEAAQPIPGAADQLKLLLANNGGAIASCLGKVDLAIKLLSSVSSMPAARQNLALVKENMQTQKQLAPPVLQIWVVLFWAVLRLLLFPICLSVWLFYLMNLLKLNMVN